MTRDEAIEYHKAYLERVSAPIYSEPVTDAEAEEILRQKEERRKRVFKEMEDSNKNM